MPTRILPPNFALGLDKFVRVPDGIEQMAVDGRSTTAEDVWDGTGAGDTGSDWTRGGVGSETVPAAHSGTNGLDTGVTSVNNVWWFDYGSNRNLSGVPFDSISFWINPQAYPEGSVLRCAWAASGGMTVVGNSVKVSDYIANNDLDVWQRVSIPLIDFNLGTTPVGRFIFQAKQTSGQRFYFDDIDLLNSSEDGPYRYRVVGVAGEERYVARITLLVASDVTGWNSSAFADIAGGLELGLILRQGKLSTQEVIWSVTMKDNMDLFGQLVPADPVTFADDEMMMVFNLTPNIASIILTEDDGLEFVVRDDLTTLTNMRAFLQYGRNEALS